MLEEPGRVERDGSSGLGVVRAPEPMHYYPLFSATMDMDTVLTIYPGNRYEASRERALVSRSGPSS